MNPGPGVGSLTDGPAAGKGPPHSSPQVSQQKPKEDDTQTSSKGNSKTDASSPTDAFTSVAGKVLLDPIPRVIQEAKVGRPFAGSKGYHPAVALSLAAGLRWTPYGTFMSALRNLMLVDSEDSSSRSSARRYLSSLTDHRGPFAVDRRFPDDEIYVCIDRAPLNLVLLSLSRELRKDAKHYYDAVQDAVYVVMSEDKGALQVLFSRSTFESAFQLHWSE